MSKFSRNSSCYCGSGKKYKNCCFKRDNYSKNLPKDALSKLKMEFSKFNQKDLIKTISSLQLCSKNHSQGIRLEVASRIACSIKNESNKNITIQELDTLLLKYLPYNGFIGLHEDPIEGLFTYNIQFIDGNYIIFGGLAPSEYYILQNILNTIFLCDNEYSNLDYLQNISLAILKLSDNIAKSSNLSRYQTSEDRFRKDVFFLQVANWSY